MNIKLVLIIFLISGCTKKAVVSNSSVQSSQPVVQVYWTDYDFSLAQPVCKGKIFPLKYRTLEVNYPYLRKSLLIQGTAPGALNSDTVILPLPLPEGGWEDFELTQVSVMAPELAAKFPDIKTYAGKSKIYPADNVRIDISPQGFKAMILSTRGTIMIDPYCSNDSLHIISYYKKDLPENSKDNFEKK